jgi:DNA-binding response OmpR family regulator
MNHMSKKILVVEDDEDIAFIEQDYLRVVGYDVHVANNGTDGLQEALHGDYDLVLLDVMLPGMDGFEILRRIRDVIDIPILLVTAKKTDIDKIRGLGYGADAYIEKPFSPGVLVAKVKAALAQYERLKGAARQDRHVITVGKIRLESDTHRVFVDGKEKKLVNMEFKLLEYLMMHPGIVFSSEQLYHDVWGMEAMGSTSTVSVHINHIRAEIEEDPSNPKHVVTVWGVGYKFQ